MAYHLHKQSKKQTIIPFNFIYLEKYLLKIGLFYIRFNLSRKRKAWTVIELMFPLL